MKVTVGKLLDGYIAKWNSYPKDEVKFRVARPSVLSPSKSLLEDWKNGKVSWEEYENAFLTEIAINGKAKRILAEIFCLLKKGNNVRLICYEKNPPCHRFTLINLIKKMLEDE